MEYKINEIYAITDGLLALMDIKTKSKVKFKILKNYKKAYDTIVLVEECLKDKGVEEREEFLETTESLALDPFKVEELEDLEISAKTLFLLDKIINDGVRDE